MARNIDREGPIQKACYQFLRTQYPHALVFSVPNELASRAGGGVDGRKRQTMIRNIQANAKKMGMLPGMGDLCMLNSGRFYVFEIKAKGNYQQDNQKAAEALVDANGGYYYVIRSIDDLKEVLGSNCPTIPLRGSIS